MEKLYDALGEYDIFYAEGQLKEAQRYAAVVCQSDETYFLVNGTSSGILSAIFSAAKKNGELLVARNCPKSVYHALELRQLKAHFLYPEMLAEGILGDISAEMVEEAMELYPEAKTLILTSPTCDGVVSDVKGIVKAAHAKGVTVIVDETHGAHFLKESGFPKSAIRCGADVVIQSTDKNIPALTQTALLHVNKDYPYKAKVKRYLEMFQTENPSHVLITSIDQAMHWYMEEGKDVYKEYLSRLKKLRAAFVTQLQHLTLSTPENVFDYDISKVLISTGKTNLSSGELQQRLLKKYHIRSEIISPEHVRLAIKVTDVSDNYGRLLEAILEIDNMLEEKSSSMKKREEIGKRKVIMPIFEAIEKKKKTVPLLESMGEVSASYVYIYPPGIPFLTPGEKISERCVRYLQNDLEERREIRGLSVNQEIEIVWEEFFT